jgi:hypothetical protein
LLLIASPSYGSEWADKLSLLSRFYNQSLGIQLQWGSWSLSDLDARFKELINNRDLPSFIGLEAYENRFIFHRKWLPDKHVVVTEQSAGRYFGAPILLRGTDHFSTVKPTGPDHPSHELLVDFWEKFQRLPGLLRLATRWHFKSGVTEEELLLRTNNHVVSGTRTTTHPRGKVTVYHVTGWNFGITYWLEYHHPTENGGGSILLDEFANEKWSGMVTSKDCDTGIKQCRTNIWFLAGSKEDHKPEYCKFVAAVVPLASEGFAVESTEAFKHSPPTLPKPS